MLFKTPKALYSVCVCVCGGGGGVDMTPHPLPVCSTHLGEMSSYRFWFGVDEGVILVLYYSFMYDYLGLSSNL